MSQSKSPTALIILDGWGISDSSQDNAIHAANTPVWDRLWAQNPHSMVATSGLAVGLPEGQMGNSEVGHMNIGAGRTVYQNFTRITKSVDDGTLFSNEVLLQAMDAAITEGRAVHLLGLLSPGGVHSHELHIQALCRMAVERGAKEVYVHAFLDGRDTPPRSALASIEALEATLAALGVGAIATLCGRYFAMDRDNRWDRVQRAYDAMTLGQGAFCQDSAVQALTDAYARDENDEFVQATVIVDSAGLPKGIVQDGDAVICANFRPDRSREITRAFVDQVFEGFERAVVPQLADFVMLTEYASSIAAACAFPPRSISNGLGEYMASLGKTQLRIAETEKYAHVTFFFNGGREQPYVGEERILVPSPNVATYDLQPEMSAPEVTDHLIEALASQRFDLLVCNFANPDMVGHTGNFAAAVEAVEAVDRCLGRVLDALEKVGGQALITADHGNVEQMRDAHTGQAHTAHTLLPVGLIYAGPQAIRLADGCLADLAPTLLALMALAAPAEMSGRSLLLE
ncbi:MAG: 2,3-bisphosphoglycerate-independent phosphoglycerate mutase [Motiliproteus sp.]|jgi:2,3-bisphosphoglycerate-independent phosphoglycerate mutase